MIQEDNDRKLDEKDYFPPPPTPNIRTNQVCYAIIQPDVTPTAFIDLMGKFPKRSSRGHQYIMVGYHYDGNYILGKPLKDRKGTTIAEAWSSLHNNFKKSRVAPTTYVLDNKISSDLVQLFDEEKITY